VRLLRAFLRFFFTHFYTGLAWSYDAVAWLVSVGKWNDWVFSALPLAERDPVLELGHGTGHLLARAAALGRQAYGVDASPQMGRIARRRLRRRGHPVQLVRARAQALPFQGGIFGTVISTFPTEYIADPATTSEARRTLIDGGRLIVLPLAEIEGRSLPERMASWLFRVTGQSGDLPLAWEEHFRAAGLQPRREDAHLRNSRVVRLIGQR